VLHGATGSSVFSQLKDVEKTHVREDCLLRGQNRTEGREHISGALRRQASKAKFNLT
jgi:hypothetical protein